MEIVPFPFCAGEKAAYYRPHSYPYHSASLMHHLDQIVVCRVTQLVSLTYNFFSLRPLLVKCQKLIKKWNPPDAFGFKNLVKVLALDDQAMLKLLCAGNRREAFLEVTRLFDLSSCPSTLIFITMADRVFTLDYLVKYYRGNLLDIMQKFSSENLIRAFFEKMESEVILETLHRSSNCDIWNLAIKYQSSLRPEFVRLITKIEVIQRFQAETALQCRSDLWHQVWHQFSLLEIMSLLKRVYHFNAINYIRAHPEAQSILLQPGVFQHLHAEYYCNSYMSELLVSRCGLHHLHLLSTCLPGRLCQEVLRSLDPMRIVYFYNNCFDIPEEKMNLAIQEQWLKPYENMLLKYTSIDFLIASNNRCVLLLSLTPQHLKHPWIHSQIQKYTFSTPSTSSAPPAIEDLIENQNFDVLEDILKKGLTADEWERVYTFRDTPMVLKLIDHYYPFEEVFEESIDTDINPYVCSPLFSCVDVSIN